MTRAFDSSRFSGKIALFLPSLGGGGAEKIFTNLANGFVAYPKLEIELVLVQAVGEYLSELDPGVRVIDLQAGRTLSAIPKLIEYLNSAKPDILLSGLAHANIAAILAARLANFKTRIFVSEHNTLSLHASDSSSISDRLLPLVAKLIYPWADGVIAVSKSVAGDLQKITSDSLVQVIFNPILDQKFIDKSQAKAEDSVSDLVKTRSKLLLGVGRLEKVKDFETLIRAFAQTRLAEDSELWILGEGGERARLEALIASLGLADYVKLPGFILNPYPCIRQADALAISSIHEALPTVMIEAMACGVPVISTDWSGAAKEFKPERITPVGDHDRLAQAILEVWNNPPPRGDLRDRVHAFRVGEIIPQYLRLFFCPEFAIS